MMGETNDRFAPVPDFPGTTVKGQRLAVFVVFMAGVSALSKYCHVDVIFVRGWLR